MLGNLIKGTNPPKEAFENPHKLIVAATGRNDEQLNLVSKK